MGALQQTVNLSSGNWRASSNLAQSTKFLEYIMMMLFVGVMHNQRLLPTDALLRVEIKESVFSSKAKRELGKVIMMCFMEV